MEKLNIILVRHGESERNIGECPEKFDADILLTERGIEQTHIAGKKLHEYMTQKNIGVSNSRLWSSPYSRTIQTAEIINSYIQFPKIYEDPLLVEMDFGLWDGQPRDKWEGIAPAEYAEFKKRKSSKRGKFQARAAGGESPFDVYQRICSFVPTLKEDFDRVKNVIIICHGITMRSFSCRYYHESFDYYPKLENPNNCEIWILEKDGIKIL